VYVHIISSARPLHGQRVDEVGTDSAKRRCPSAVCARRSDRRRRQDITGGLAQVESTGNPVARSYWSRQFAWKPFAVYNPASSAVGMYQMTDAAYAEAAVDLGITKFVRIVIVRALQLEVVTR
jgi:hypothetical protein